MENSKLVQDELQKAYDEWHSEDIKMSKGDKRRLNQILDLLEVESGKRILDVGCGKGIFLQYAEKRGLHTFGVDISQKAVEIAKKTAPNSKISAEGAEALPWDGDYFDYITCLGSLEHFSNLDKSIKEIARVLKPNGLSYIFVPNSYFIGHIYMAYRYGIPPDEAGQTFSERFGTSVEWQNLLEKNGLRAMKIYKYNTIWASKKVNPITKVLYNLLLRPFIPLNLSYSFVFICKKSE